MSIPAAWLNQIINKAQLHFGLLYRPEQSADLLSRLQWRAEELHKADYHAWLQQVAQAEWSSQLQQELLPAFTVGETYFCRDPLVSQWLIQHWLPANSRPPKTAIRIWSAGCCRGEEAYSILFMFSAALAATQRQCALDIVATDLNPEFIAKANQGIYRPTSFRNCTEQFRQRYFTALSHNSWQVKPAWRSAIKFMPLNLINGPSPNEGPFELIFCRNVLMYFTPEQAQKTIQRFLQLLTPDGLLLLNAVEANIAIQAGFQGFWAADNYAVPATALTKVSTASIAFCPQWLTEPLPMPSPQLAAIPFAAGIAVPQVQDNPKRHRYQSQQLTAVVQQTAARYDSSQTATAHYYLQQAKQAANMQQLEQAHSWLNQSLQLAPTDAAAYLFSAQIYNQQQQPALALQALQKSLYLEPDLVVAHLLHAKLLMTAGKTHAAFKALQLCSKLLQRYPIAAEIPHSDHLSAGQLQLICQQLTAQVSI